MAVAALFRSGKLSSNLPLQDQLNHINLIVDRNNISISIAQLIPTQRITNALGKESNRVVSLGSHSVRSSTHIERKS